MIDQKNGIPHAREFIWQGPVYYSRASPRRTETIDYIDTGGHDQMALEHFEKDFGDYIHKSQVSVHMIWIVTVFMTCCFTATKVLPCCNL